MKTEPGDRRAQQLRRLRAELVRLRAREVMLRGRASGASALEGSRSGDLGRQRKAGGGPSAQKIQQEREAVAKQIAATQQYIERLEAQLASPDTPGDS